MKFRALAIDIDGTITDAERRLSLKATEKLRTLDTPIVLATGNILCYARAAAKLIGIGCNVIAENGGVVTDGFDKKPYVSDVIGECEQAFKILSQEFDLEKLDPVHRRTEIVLRRNFDLGRAKALLDRTKLDVEIIDTHYAIHIKSRKVNKGTGLVRMAEMMGLKASEFIAIGDSVNDLEMLGVAGYAIAVSNADDLVKDIADHVTGKPYGEGTAEAVNFLVSEGMLQRRR
ncbi:MAG: phosphoglycolate phosphatase [Methanosarcinaceae archaeon]|nr:phosphoglycolate phosphatase [Methanosarcinaceae archaeon]